MLLASALQQSEFSYMYTFIHTFFFYPHFFKSSFLFRSLQTIEQRSLCYGRLFILYIRVIYFIHSSVYMSIPISQSVLFLPLLVTVSLFSTSVDSISALQISSSVSFFWILHISSIVQYLSFSADLFHIV